MKAIKIEDVFCELDRLQAGWGVYSVSALMNDGSYQTGACQGDGDSNWALETFDPEE